MHCERHHEKDRKIEGRPNNTQYSTLLSEPVRSNSAVKTLSRRRSLPHATPSTCGRPAHLPVPVVHVDRGNHRRSPLLRGHRRPVGSAVVSNTYVRLADLPARGEERREGSNLRIEIAACASHFIRHHSDQGRKGISLFFIQSSSSFKVTLR